MSPKLDRCAKSLTGSDPLCNERIRHILYIVCTNPEPLSSTEIHDRMIAQFRDHSRSTYTVIERLCPIITRANFRKYVRYLGVPAAVRYIDATSIRISEPKIKARGTPTMKALDKAEKERKDAYLEYRNLIQSPSIQQIDEDTIKTKEARLDNKQKKYAKLLRRTYRYSPNLRTFMLYLFNESYLRKVSVIRVHQVLSTQNIVDVLAPFLKDWQDLEQCGFNVCNVLMTISKEFRSQLHLDDAFLSSAIMERYYAEVEDFFSLVSAIPRSDFLASNKQPINPDKLDKLPEIKSRYRKRMLPLMNDSIETKLKVLRGYDREVQLFEFTQQSGQNQKGQRQDRFTTKTHSMIHPSRAKDELNERTELLAALPILHCERHQLSYFDKEECKRCAIERKSEKEGQPYHTCPHHGIVTTIISGRMPLVPCPECAKDVAQITM